MGIKYFFHYLKNHFENNLYKLKKDETVKDLEEEMSAEVRIDNLLIDMNGIFHPSAQKIYQYGDYKPMQRFLPGAGRRPPRVSGLKQQIACFEDICKTVESILTIAKPTRRLIMCVDGVAPASKKQQQRQRRFLSAVERAEDSKAFDSNCISPGTKFMDCLTKYVDWYIRKRITEDPYWASLEVIFSNEKSCGEGEHKLLHYVRKYGQREETFCIHGMDADLIMLALASHMPKFYILREEQRDPEYAYRFIDVNGLRHDLGEAMRWESGEKYTFDLETAMDDFVLLCFTVGNDFLPHLPGIEIVEGGIDFMLDVYKKVCQSYGHLTKKTEDGVVFRKRALKHFLGTIGQYEKSVLENKMLHKDKYFPDYLLENCAQYREGKYTVDMDKYRRDYYTEVSASLGQELDQKKFCHEYLEGMAWVLSYYTKGVTNWDWCFKHHYAPFSTTLAEHVSSFQHVHYDATFPASPYAQLLAILPPKSAPLLPPPLDTILTDKDSPMQVFCPDEFDVDLSGKRREWEGVALLPHVDYTILNKAYRELIGRVDERDRKRNIVGKSYVYRRDETPRLFKSFYGDLTTLVKTSVIEI